MADEDRVGPPRSGESGGTDPFPGRPAAAPAEPSVPRSRGGRTAAAYLAVAALGAWFVAALVLPSPVGLVVPAVPYLALVLAGAGVVLAYLLVRRVDGPRWSPAYRRALAVGVGVGLAVAGLIGVVEVVGNGCPSLPAAPSLTELPGGWQKVGVPAWKVAGQTVLYFFGASWCPYCSATSWAIWKALSEFGTVAGNYTSYSFGSPEPDPYTPEMVLASATLSSSTVDFEVSEYDGTVDGATVAPSGCFQEAYVSAYSGGNIPFVVVNGQYLHVGTLVPPASLSAWNRSNDANGAAYVASSVRSETGAPWGVVEDPTWWIMAYLAKGSGVPVPVLASEYGWTATTESHVAQDVNATD